MHLLTGYAIPSIMLGALSAWAGVAWMRGLKIGFVLLGLVWSIKILEDALE